jgi:hypothetical protein
MQSEKSIQTSEIDLIDFIYSTTSGIYRHTNGHTKTISSGDYFGITKFEELWLVANRSDCSIELYDFDFKLKNKIYGLVTKHTHQIDVIDDMLHIVNTDQNSILITDLNFDKKTKVFPNGIARRGDDNFCHFNSVYCSKNFIFVMAHNLGEETQKNSELYFLDKSYNVKKKLNLGCFSCHNIICKDKKTYICYSKQGTIKKNKESLFVKNGFFTRGLSISNDLIIYGFNKVSKEPFGRFGKISINTKNKEFILTTADPVNEIRQINYDFGLSKNSCVCEKTFESNYPKLI